MHPINAVQGLFHCAKGVRSAGLMRLKVQRVAYPVKSGQVMAKPDKAVRAAERKPQPVACGETAAYPLETANNDRIEEKHASKSANRGRSNAAQAHAKR